jgi:hypothetical protein
MKPNTRLRLEQGLFIVAILLVVGLLFRRKQVEHMDHGDKEEEMSIDDLIKYVNDTEDLSENPFYVAAMLTDKITADQEANLIRLASEDNKKLMLTLLKSLQ